LHLLLFGASIKTPTLMLRGYCWLK